MKIFCSELSIELCEISFIELKAHLGESQVFSMVLTRVPVQINYRFLSRNKFESEERKKFFLKTLPFFFFKLKKNFFYVIHLFESNHPRFVLEFRHPPPWARLHSKPKKNFTLRLFARFFFCLTLVTKLPTPQFAF